MGRGPVVRMAAFKILSWNVETFGEEKLATVASYFASVVRAADPDIVLIIETTKLAQADMAVFLRSALEQMTDNSYFEFGSDPTGKAKAFDALIPASKWPRKASYASFRDDIELCYTRLPNGDLQLTPPFTQSAEDHCREALERVGLIRIDVETYSALFKYDPALYRKGRGPLIAVGSHVGLRTPDAARLVSTDPAGVDIGYGTATCPFSGRSPWVINLYFSDPENPGQSVGQFPLVCFHGPFKVPGGKGTRAAAAIGALRLLTYDQTRAPVALGTQPQAVVAGDFNVPYDWNQVFTGLVNPVTGGNPSFRLYGSYYASGFRLPVREKTSLTPVSAADRTWTLSTQYRANAYDNILVRGAGGAYLGNNVLAEAIDLVDHTFNRAGSYLQNVPGIPVTPTMFDAFEYFRTEVSDHLPVRCHVEVATRP